MIPCLNEASTVGNVIRRVPKRLPDVGDVKILVIDDGSSDGTASVALEAGADLVLRHKRNIGLGSTFRDGLEASLELGADIVVNIDADGQYDPEEMSMLLEPILSRRADIVLGNRQIKQLAHMSQSRKWGNRIASWVTRRLSGLPIIDAQSGYRALTRDAAVRLIMRGDYTYTQEMIIEASSRGLAIEEVPITFNRRSDGNSRLITGIWSYALRSAGVIMRSYRDHKPLRVFSIIGLIILLAGGILGMRVLAHFFTTGMVTPYLPTAMLAAILGVVGFQVLIFGLVADMIKTHRQLSEEALLRIRKLEDSRGTRKF